MKKPKRKFPHLKLESICTVREAGQLKDHLLSLRDAADSVTVDIAAVERIDTANLQVLCAFVAGRRAAGRSTLWKGESSAMAQAVALAGLSPVLEFSAVPRPAQPDGEWSAGLVIGKAATGAQP